MGCIYTKNGTDYNLMELSKLFYTSKVPLSNSSIYSSSEKAESVKKIINDEILKNRGAWENLKEDKFGQLYEFISEENSEFFESIGESGRSRLAPEYIKEKRISKFIENKLIDNPSPDTKDVKVNLSKDLETLKKMFPSTSNEVLQYYLNEILDIIDIEEKTRNFGIGLHNLVECFVKGHDTNSSEYKGQFDALYKEHENILSDDKKGWKIKIDRIVENIYNHVSALGDPISEVLIITNNVVNLKGRIDLVVITDSGQAHIFDIKVSKHHYSDWDSAKLRTVDWQLALYRQLLGQHIKIKGTTLNLIPIKVGSTIDGKLDPGNLTFTGVINRSAENPELQMNGTIHRIAEKIIPTKTIVEHDDSRKTEIIQTLNVLFPDYSIRTSKENTDIEEIVKIAKKRGRWEWSHDVKDVDGIQKDKITVNKFNSDGTIRSNEEMETEFRSKVQVLIDYLKSIENRNVGVLADALMNAVLDPLKNPIELGSKDKKISVNKVMKDYINGDYEVVQDIEEATALGIILLRNKKSNEYVVISISANNQKAKYNDEMYFSDIEYHKVLLILDKFYDDLDMDYRTIQDIIVYNLEGVQLKYKPLEKALSDYKVILQRNHMTTKLNTSHLISPLKNAVNVIRSTYRAYSGSDKEAVENIFKAFDEPFDSITYEKLKEARDAMVKAFPELSDKTTSSEISFNDEKEYIFALLNVAMLFKSGYSPVGDFEGMKNWGIYFSDFKSLVSSLYTHNQSEYDQREKKILGIIGGLKTITPDKVSSRDLQTINQIISNANSQIRHLLVEQSSQIRFLTKQYFEDINYTKTSMNWIGDARSQFKNLFEVEGGEISNRLRMKNPYSLDSKNAMSDAERKYAKQILFEIKKYMLNLSDREIKLINPDSLDSLRANDKIAKAIDDGSYFSIPLIRSEQIDRNKKYLDEFNAIKETAKDRFGEIYDFLNPQELSAEDLKRAKVIQEGFYEMYDVYSKQSEAFKIEMINKNGIDYYELNLDTIAHRVAFSKIRKNILDNRLPIINNYIWWMKLLAGKQNKDISKELEYIANQLKLAAYDQPIVEEEFEDVVSATSLAKRMTTALMLAFRPVLLVKELSIGLFKGASLAATQIYGKDQFNLGDLTTAVKKMLTIDNKLSQDWNLLDMINNYYGFANMDTNTISKKMQTNRRGLFMGLNRWMYASNTIPDYYNRLSLFIAKMIHDGSYDAHYLDDKKMLRYDPKKDGRFSYYFENRDKYKSKSGKFTPAPNDVKFNEQRNLYNLLISELNKERVDTGREMYEDDDIVDQAYSEKERASFKSFTDTAYGYYDKDSQAQWHNTTFGIVFLQFMQFWPGKMHMWFGKPVGTKESKISLDQSPTGRFTQKVTKDENGNDVKWYRKAIYNEEGEILRFEEVTEDTGDPLIIWEGTPQEGLVYSILYTLQDIFKGDFKEALSNTERMNRVYFAMADTLMMMLIFGLIKALLDAFIEENGTDGISGNTALFMQSATKKVLTEANMYENTLGALRTEPAFISAGTRLASDIADVITNDRTIQSLTSRNFRAAEFWQE